MFKLNNKPLNSAKILLNQVKSSFSSQNNKNQIIFRQLIDHTSFTYTYILADVKSREAVIIDPVFEKADRDLKLIKELNLNLLYAMNTHVHADHVTGSGKIKNQLKSVKSVISAISDAKADIQIKEGDEIKFGDQSLTVFSTPGHTNGCLTYVSHSERCLFTGDALLIRGCGRTDFQQGSADLLYESIHKKIFTLPEDYTIYPGHDYNGNLSTTVSEEKRFNPRLTKIKSEFVEVMKNLNLANPKMIDIAVPANMVCGLHYVCKK